MNYWLDVYNDAMEGEYLSDKAVGPIRWWYDRTPGRTLTSDPEGELVALCDRCAAGERVAWAADDADLSTCELCGCEVTA